MMQNHFELFGLAPAYRLERESLECAWRGIQSRIHPDRHAAGGDAARRAAMQWATRVNEAYRILRDPLARARYLLELHGVDPGLETNTAMPAGFLLRQMELREALDEALTARDAQGLERLRTELAGARRALEAELGELIDGRRDYPAAAERLRRLMFLARFDEDIDAAQERMEA